MDYREFAAPPPLRTIVQCMWTLRADACDEQCIVPDGRSELIVSRGDPVRDLDSGELQPRVMLAGQLERAMRIAPTGVVDLVGVRFRPHGLRALIDAPAQEWTGRRVDLTGAHRRLARELVGADEARIVDVLATHMDAPRVHRHAHADTAAAIAAIARGRGVTPVATIAQMLAMHPRRLERSFQRDVGIAPKTLSRIVRLQHTIHHVEATARLDGAATAAACGYSDQSHLIREFRALVGMTPGRYFATEHPLADLLAGVSETSNP